jgi:hypothetical protein
MEELLPMCAISRQGLGPTAWLSIREQAIIEEKQMELGYEPGTYGNGNKMIVQ